MFLNGAKLQFLAIAGFVLSVASATPVLGTQSGPAQKSVTVVGTQRAKHQHRWLISGLDGALYLPYRPATIQWVQKALRERGLYEGPMNGILDWPTMKSIYAFQEANKLQRCGVPTPRTRQMLEQGSHTDLTF